ncbi:MAG TPA: hypothetical protein VG276_19065 [Actinomycetes bacterium]|jgi:hypothetical protein|nr:hypothetical protein [Actinomycetes bacterium]
MPLLRCAVPLPCALVDDEAALARTLAAVLDTMHQQARETGWRLVGLPAACLGDPESVLGVPCAADEVIVLVAVEAVDELATLAALPAPT